MKGTGFARARRPELDEMALERDELVRPTVNVKVPEIKLRLQDLLFLRSLADLRKKQPTPKASVIERLRFLDLVTEAAVPIDPEEVVKLDAEKKESLQDLEIAVEQEDWEEVTTIAYTLRRNQSARRPRKQLALTDKGRQILRQGEVRVRLRDAGGH